MRNITLTITSFLIMLQCAFAQLPSKYNPIYQYNLDYPNWTTATIGATATSATNILRANNKFNVVGGAAGFEAKNSNLILPIEIIDKLENLNKVTKVEDGKGYTIAYWVKVPSTLVETDQVTPSTSAFPYHSSDAIHQVFYAREASGNIPLGMSRIKDRVVLNRVTTTTNPHKPWDMWLWDPVAFKKLDIWYEVFYVVQFNKARVYMFEDINGTATKDDDIEHASLNYFHAPDISNVAQIGFGSPDGEKHTAFDLDDIRIYNRAFDSDEIKVLRRGSGLSHLPLYRLQFDGNLNSTGDIPTDPAAAIGTITYNNSVKAEGSHAVLINAPDDYIELDVDHTPVYKNLPFTKRTVAFWMHAQAVSADRVLYDEGDNEAGMGLRISNGKIEFKVSRKDGAVVKNRTIVSTCIEAGKWIHVAAVFNDGLMELYLNGKRNNQAKAPFSEVNNKANRSALGGYVISDVFNSTSANNIFQGFIDDFNVYDEVLFPSEIATLMETNSTLIPSLAGCYLANSLLDMKFEQNLNNDASTGNSIVRSPAPNGQTASYVANDPTPAVGNNSIDFGGDYYIELSGNALTNDYIEKSVSFWMWSDSLATQKMDVYEEGDEDNGMAFRVDGNELQLKICSNESGSAECETVTACIQDKQWIHVAGVYQRGIISLYLNGNLVNAVEVPFETVNSLFTNGSFGGSKLAESPFSESADTNDSFFTGKCDNLFVSSLALLPSDLEEQVSLFSGFELDPVTQLPIPPIEVTCNKEVEELPTNDFNFARKSTGEEEEVSEDEVSEKEVSEEKMLNNLLIYPNPSKGEFEIFVTSETDDIFEFSIISITGIVIYTDSKKVLSGINKIPVLLPQNTASGAYIVAIRNNKFQTNRRIIINK
jgi:Concanavalin A-like lectin/glucanases superfamily/Secretion system C-terminal sorting domain